MTQEIIAGIAKGNRRVFLSYYNRVSVPFLKFIYFRAGGDMSLAEEVFQEAFTRLIQTGASLRKLGNDEMLFPWLCGVAKRILADHFREKGAKKTISLESLDPIVLEALLEVESRLVPDPVAAHPQTQLLIGMVLSAMKPTYAEALKAKYCEGLSVRQIARKLDETTKTIEGRLFRAREAFRVLFQKVRRELETGGAYG